MREYYDRNSTFIDINNKNTSQKMSEQKMPKECKINDVDDE